MFEGLIRRAAPQVQTFTIVDVCDLQHVIPRANEVVTIEMNHEGYTVFRHPREIPWEDF